MSGAIICRINTKGVVSSLQRRRSSPLTASRSNLDLGGCGQMIDAGRRSLAPLAALTSNKLD
eukprot:4845594-Pyramimonas_sp.AAC.1